MSLINFENNLDLKCYKNCVLVVDNADQVTTTSLTDKKLDVQVVTLSTEDNAKLLEQL